MTDSLHLRHDDADIDGFAARVSALLLRRPPLLVDLSGHDERCDRIDLAVHPLDPDRFDARHLDRSLDAPTS